MLKLVIPLVILIALSACTMTTKVSDQDLIRELTAEVEELKGEVEILLDVAHTPGTTSRVRENPSGTGEVSP